jgi:peptidoglycan/xylan/chitin deacetylase (PgdA/CDA1 family)
MKAAKRILKKTIASPGGWRLSAPLRRRRVFVLAYHRIGRPGDPFRHVDAGVFRAQMQWLRRHCRVLHPAEIRSALDGTRRPTAVVTFDDGYLDYYTLAVPVLRELGLIAANFLSTAFIDRGQQFWWDRVHLSVYRSQASRFTLPWSPATTFGASAAGRYAFRKACTRHIGSVPAAEQEALVQAVFRATGVNADALDIPRQVMTWDQVRASMDATCYGGHTHTHVRVPLTETVVLDDEVRLCRERIKQETAVAPTIFAYPTGDTSPAGKDTLRKHGFEIAYSLKEETYVPQEVDWLDVPRFPGPATVEGLAWIASGRARGDIRR